ncbi:hypothetical protein AB0F65_17280 [Nocardia rhamnosiphila]|uniref:hypothetical protein n=2 Tax=Nocardia rhamnosiphila TaxID=426716 RepID=UPI000AC464C4|nr:hypothetical protein [Nocardia rhamnosiphila]
MSRPYSPPPQQPGNPAPLWNWSAPPPNGYPMPAPGFPGPRYDTPGGDNRQTPPGGWTGISAGILALLEGAAGAAAAIAKLLLDFGPVGVAVGTAYGVLAMVLLIGGGLLLRRSNAGRLLIICGCVAAIPLSVLGPGPVAGIVGIALTGIGLVITLILAALSSTKRWIASERTPAVTATGAPYRYR